MIELAVLRVQWTKGIEEILLNPEDPFVPTPKGFPKGPDRAQWGTQARAARGALTDGRIWTEKDLRPSLHEHECCGVRSYWDKPNWTQKIHCFFDHLFGHPR